MPSIRSELRSWAIAFLIVLPAAIPYATHFSVWKPYSLPTGYIQHDMPIYMAKARETFDDGRFHLLYSNPCSQRYDSPRVYFQPWTFLLGWIQWKTRWRPLWLFPLFWWLSAWGCGRLMLGLYRAVAGEPDSATKRRGLALFCWGGGVLSISGAVWGWAVRGKVVEADLSRFDPFGGWWFLNLGRNLVYPTEALYHLLFLGAILAVIRRRRVLAAAIAALNAACTPFSGFELLAVLAAWTAVEVVFLEDKERLKPFGAAILAITGLFLFYIVFFLNLFDEHRQIAARMALPWEYRAESFVPAYALAGAPAVWSLRRLPIAARTLSRVENRLFLIWFLVAFALSVHEFAVRPRQPIHFTRGYVWTPLFLLGLPATLAGLERLRSFGGWKGRAAVAAIMLLGLSDNLVWFGCRIADSRTIAGNGLRLDSAQREVLDRLNDPRLYGHVVVGNDHRLLYLAIAETPLRSWISHWIETPEFETRREEMERAFRLKVFEPRWEKIPLLVAIRRDPKEPAEASRGRVPTWLKRQGAEPWFSNRAFDVYRVPLRERGSPP